ncbi:MAG: PEP/pyruvate-binding domain-containing protein, partial [Pyrobaculum sp.]
MGKYVYSFVEADHNNKKLFGGKGASLIQMTKLGLRVPPGFIITTEACKKFYEPRQREISEMESILLKNPPPEVRDEVISKLHAVINSLDVPQEIWEEVVQYVHRLEEEAGRKFGDPHNPLLVSVRSGAAVSMPGMMDTVLNLGLNDETVKGLAARTGNEWFAYDAYRRFLQMFGKIVLSIDEKLFSTAWEEVKKKYGVKDDPDVPLEGLKEAVEKFKEIIKKERGGFPQDPWEQLRLAVKAVFRSWMSP